MAWQIVFPNGEQTPKGLTLQPVRLTHSDRGGCWEAIVRVDGALEDTQFCTDWLARRIHILNDVGSLVWWGVVTGVTVGLGKWAVGRTLAGLVNRCAVEYSAQDRTSGDNYEITAWADDATSQTAYGTREHLVSIGDASVGEATAQRATTLAQGASPKTMRNRTSGNGATLTCWGAVRFLEWKYYTNLVGRIEHDANDAAEMSIGWMLTSGKVGFFEGTLQHLDAQLGALREGDKIIVSGSTANDGTKIVSQAASSATKKTLVSSGIGFEANDDIFGSGTDFRDFRTGEFVKISGSFANSRYHYIDGKPTDAYMTTKEALTGTITYETPGLSVTIEQGHKINIEESTTDEVMGDAASVTIKLVGFQLAQSFVAPATMTLDRVAVKVGKVGSPVDVLHVRLYSNSGGNPGTWLDTATLDTSAMGETPDWIWANFATGTSITATTTYWLILARSGSDEAVNYYTAALVEGAYETTKAWDNATWSALTWLPAGTVSVPFKLWDIEDTSAAIARIVTNCGGSFVTAVTVSSTGVERNQWTDNGARGDHELTRLLDIGTSAGARLICDVTQTGTLVVTAEPAQPSDTLTLPRYGDDDRITQHNGAEWQNGANAAGQWVNLALPQGIGRQWNISPAYVRKSEFDVSKNAWSLNFGEQYPLTVYRGT